MPCSNLTSDSVLSICCYAAACSSSALLCSSSNLTLLYSSYYCLSSWSWISSLRSASWSSSKNALATLLLVGLWPPIPSYSMFEGFSCVLSNLLFALSSVTSSPSEISSSSSRYLLAYLLLYDCSTNASSSALKFCPVALASSLLNLAWVSDGLKALKTGA